MVKIYLNADNKLIIDRNNVKKMPSSVVHSPIFDSNRQSLEIPDVMSETSFSEIVNKDGLPYGSFAELESLVMSFFASSSLENEVTLEVLEKGDVTYKINGQIGAKKESSVLSVWKIETTESGTVMKFASCLYADIETATYKGLED